MSPLRNRDSHRCAWERGGNGTERTCNDGERDGAHRKNARRCAAPAAGVGPYSSRAMGGARERREVRRTNGERWVGGTSN